MNNFKVYLKAHALPYQFVEGRISGASAASGASNQFLIGFSPTMTGQSTTWVGGHIIFSSGALKNSGGQIASEVKSGTTLLAVTLAEQLPYAPTAGDTFWMVRRSGTLSVGNAAIVDLTPYVDNVTFATDIDLGFENATITLNQNAKSLSRIFSQYIGRYVEIQDVLGRRCYSGVLTVASIQGWGGSITAIGHRATFNWFDIGNTYDTTATNTIPKILRDICALNPFISTNVFNIDRGDTLHTAQTAVGGIGPRDWSKNFTKSSDAIKEILDLGNYGISFDKVALQVWHDCIASTAVISQTPITPTYIITEANLEIAYGNVEIAGDISDTYTQVMGSYTDTTGNFIRTSSAYTYPLIPQMGFRVKEQSGNGSTAALAMAVVLATREDKKYIVAPGSIKISGNVKRASAANHLPCYAIKAGDVVALEANIGASSLYRNEIASPLLLTVGHTSYSSSDNSITLTATDWPLKSDLFMSRIKV